MSEKIPLTQRESDVYSFILGYMSDNNDKSPSLPEIAARFDFKKSNAGRLCDSIEKKGWLKFGEKVNYRKVEVVN